MKGSIVLLKKSCSLLFPLLAHIVVFFTGVVAAEQNTESEDSAFPVIKGLDILEATPLMEGNLLALERVMGVGVDPQGRVFVTQTNRWEAEEVSLLQSPYLHEEDMALTTVEAKEAWLRENYSPKIAASQGFMDQNDDGVVDLADLVIRSEKLFTLIDEDQNGVFEDAHLYADDFKEITTGVAHSVTPIGESVYATIIPSLWKLTDTDGDGRADIRERLVHGFANHIGYGNHDLHCVVRGYDGKIYWSMGDRGLNVVSQEGIRWAYPHTGAVMRCNLDGSEFEVVATGLRNCQAFDFDDYGNLFSVDHDADFQGEMERLVFLPEGSDSGWRNYYQYRTSNRVLKEAAKDLYSPWLAEKMWQPQHQGQPSHFLPPIENSWNAPAAFSYQPGAALGGKYRGHFLIGGMGEIRAIKMTPDGASFRREGEDVVVGQMGVQVLSSVFAPDGRLFFTLWNPLAGLSPLWALQLESGHDPEGAKVEALLKQGMTARPIDELVELLGFADRRVRLEAQFELAARKETKALKDAALNRRLPQLARIHGIWGLIQLKHWDEQLFSTLASEPDYELVAQSARWTGAIGAASESIQSRQRAAVGLLDHPSPRVKFLAAIACGRLKAKGALAGLERMIAQAENKSPVLREAGVIGLVGAASLQDLTALARHESEAVRIAAVVALRRTGKLRELLEFLQDKSFQVREDALRAIYDEANEQTFKRNPETLSAVAKQLSNSSPPAVAMRALAANRRLGTREALERIISYLIESETSRRRDRIVAMDVLASWSEASNLDPVDGRYFPVPAFSTEDLKQAILPHAKSLINDSDPSIAGRMIGLLAEIEATGTFLDQAVAQVLDETVATALRLAWMSMLTGLSGDGEAKLVDAIAVKGLSANVFELRLAGARYLINRGESLDEVHKFLRSALQNNKESKEVQGALRMLKQVPERSGILHHLIVELMKDRVSPDIHLDLVEAAEEAIESNEDLYEAYSQYKAWVTNQKPFGAFNVTLKGGDPNLGSTIFFRHTLALCSRCHSITEDIGQQVGPSLQGVADRLSPTELLESILYPQAEVVSGYGIQTLNIKDGRTITGTQLEETEKEIKLKQTDGKIEAFLKSDISSMTEPMGAMPSMKQILSKRELRDLVAYLSTLRMEDDSQNFAD